jgi:class 3 adenylate cyclase/tetratricopeptide (TPR) repeat protein
VGQRFPEGPVTILFSDVEGSTDLRTERGDAAAHRILQSHEDVVRRCLAAHDGREVKALGDGFMVAFASVRKALACAVAIQQGLAERNADSPGDELRIRIGVNTGEVVAEDDDLYGQAVNAAARIASRAKGGEILVSEIVRQLAGSGPEFTFLDRGRYRLKGFPDRWHLYGVAYDAAPQADAGAAFAERTPFVGRQAERAELRRLVAQVMKGAGALIMIGGEPGVGKTRLAEELAAQCAGEGFAIYTGHCYEMVGAAPYVPIVEVYEQALAGASSAQAFRQFLGDEASQIARLLPELRQLCPGIPPPLDLPAEQERRYLFNSVWEVLARTARAQPMLIVLDDIHWADEPTMLLIHHCAERLAEVPVLMVGLYRDSELEVGRPLSRTFEELTRRRLARRMTLRRLPSEHVAEMLRALAAQRPPAGLVDVIYAETEGNPFFTEEVFKHLAEEGRLFDAEGRFRTDLTVDDLDVPEGVRMVIGARLRRLGDDGPKVLGSAAVLGRVFSFELLRQVEELAEDRLLDLVEEAERARLIAPIEAGGADDRFIFAHELIRQTVLGGLSVPRRRRVHARAAEALERAHAPAVEQQAATIAHHLIEAGPIVDPRQTFQYLLIAGKWALESAAFEEALAHLEQAAERIDVVTAAERADLLFHLGTARRSNGQWEEAIDTWKEAVDTCVAAGDAERAGWICAEAADSIAWASRLQEAVAIAQRGLDLLGDEVSAVRARLLAQQGWILAAGAAPFELGDALMSQALAIADELGDPSLRGSCLARLSMNRFFWMSHQEAADAGLEAAGLLRAAGNGWEESLLLGFVQISLVAAGRYAEARQVEAYLEPLAERLGNPGALMNSRRARFGMADFAQAGDPVALEAFGWAELKFLRENGLPWINHTHAWLGLAFFLRGEWDKAREHYEAALECEPPSAMDGWARALLFEYRAYAGQRDAALALLDAAEDNRMPTAGQANTWGRWVMLLSAVEGLYVLDERARAADLYDLVVECIDRTAIVCPNYNDCRLVQRTAGIAATAARSWDDAEDHFRTALRQAEELPHLPEQAHTRRFFARMLLDRDGPGDRTEATRLATESADLYRHMGMPRHLAMVEALLP